MRWLLAWMLFGLGDLIFRSRIMDVWPTEFAHPYRLYNAVMVASDRVQGGGPGPWETVDGPAW